MFELISSGTGSLIEPFPRQFSISQTDYDALLHRGQGSFFGLTALVHAGRESAWWEAGSQIYFKKVNQACSSALQPDCEIPRFDVELPVKFGVKYVQREETIFFCPKEICKAAWNPMEHLLSKFGQTIFHYPGCLLLGARVKQLHKNKLSSGI